MGEEIKILKKTNFEHTVYRDFGRLPIVNAWRKIEIKGRKNISNQLLL